MNEASGQSLRTTAPERGARIGDANSVDYQVAVVGAGPAGSSCATALRLRGVDGVALIDKATFPRDKACGDGLGPGVTQTMGDLGLADVLKPHVPIKFLSVSGPSGVTASGPLPLIRNQTPVGYVIPRKVFDNYLCQAALQRGAANLTGWELAGAKHEKDHWLLELKNGESHQVRNVTARYLVGADGASSRVRRLLSVPANSDQHTGTAIRVYAKAGSPKSLDLRLDFVRSLLPAYGWVFPIDERHANIGVGIDLSIYKAQNLHLKDLFRKYTGELAGDYTYDETSFKSYILPYGSQLPRLAHPDQRAALIGDAGSMINPLTGEGIFYGMWAGELLAGKLANVLRKDSSPFTSLLDYENEFRARFAPHFKTNWMMKEKVQIPFWCDMVIRACKKDSTVLANLIDLMMGDKRDIDISTMFRILFRNVTPF
jgi:geranylgeranyl reductase family protein